MIGWQGLLGLVCAAIVVSGCEKAPKPPILSAPSNDTAQTGSEALSARPTTQELLAGTYKRIALVPLPLAAQVPESWNIKGDVVYFLHGPAPDGGDVQISLESGASVNPQRLQLLLDGAKKVAEGEKQIVRLLDIRTVGEMKVLEEQRVYPFTIKPGDGRVDWKVTFFVHRDLDYVPYIVNVLGMNESQYDQSKELLRKVIDSIVYEAPRPTR